MDYLKFWSIEDLKQDDLKQKNFKFDCENLNPFVSDTENLKDSIPQIAENKKDLNAMSKPQTILNKFVSNEMKILKQIKPSCLLSKSRKANFYKKE